MCEVENIHKLGISEECPQYRLTSLMNGIETGLHGLFFFVCFLSGEITQRSTLVCTLTKGTLCSTAFSRLIEQGPMHKQSN